MDNQTLFQRSQTLIPGGVNSPVRAFKAVGGTPRFIKRAAGSRVWDEEGLEYIDYVGSWGPAILGHAHPAVITAVQAAAADGLSFGAPTAAELTLAETITGLLPWVEMVRLVSSGTEATMSAIRLARGYTQREKIIKFEGCYHGHADALLVKAGSGALTFGQPSSSGVPAHVAAQTIVLEYNNSQQVRETFAAIGREIAAVIVEPVAGNMNLIHPQPDFLSTLREVCDHSGAVLIIDEVMTGFRVGLTGAQGLFDVQADLTTLGKVIGGGMPLAAFGGKREIMECLSPLGGVYQAGTLSGNPVAVAAGLATLKAIQVPDFYTTLSQKTAFLVEGLQAAAARQGVCFSAQSVGGMFGFYFSATPPTCYREMLAGNGTYFNQFFHQMLNAGINFAPAMYEAGFVSAAHSDADLHATITAAEQAFAALG